MPFPEAGRELREGLMSKALTWIKNLYLILFQWLKDGWEESMSDVQYFNIHSRAGSAQVKLAQVPKLVIH